MQSSTIGISLMIKQALNLILFLFIASTVCYEVVGQRYNLKHVDVKLATGQIISGRLIGLTSDSLIMLDKTKIVEGCDVVIKIKYSDGIISGKIKGIDEFSIVLATKQAPYEQQIRRNQIERMRVRSYPELVNVKSFQRSAYGYQ